MIDSHALPHIEEMFAELSGTEMLSTLDLQNAYHPLILQENSRDPTAFIMHDGLFCFKMCTT